MNKGILLCCLMLVGIPAVCLSAGGFIYVKNLHKKCLSNYQDCIMECAKTGEGGCSYPEGVSPDVAQCGSDCIDEYKKCESYLVTARCIMLYYPTGRPDYSKVCMPFKSEEECQSYEDSNTPSSDGTAVPSRPSHP